MPFIPVPGAYEVNAKYTLDGQQIHNVWQVAPLNPAGTFSIPEVLGVFVSWYGQHFMPEFNGNLLLQEVTMRSLAIPDAPGVVWTDGLPVAGGKGGDSLPNNSAFCITLRTALSGRSNRGRKYFSGLTDTDAVRSRLDPVIAQTLVQHVNDLIETLGTLANAMLVVVSRQNNGVKLTEGVFHQVISAAAYDNVLDSQRRRLPGRGN